MQQKPNNETITALLAAKNSGNKKHLKALLDELCAQKLTAAGLAEHPDPLQVAREWVAHPAAAEIALLCALFSYGSAAQIVKFLRSLDFELLDASEAQIRQHFAAAERAATAECASKSAAANPATAAECASKSAKNPAANPAKAPKYRFQSAADVAELFITFRRLREHGGAAAALADGVLPLHASVFGLPLPQAVPAIWALIRRLRALNPYRSQGYDFALAAANDTCALKRYAMWLRWCARADGFDLGLLDFSPAQLLLPLDVHTHRMCQLLGICRRRAADLRFAITATAALRELDARDPLRYDFALYRLSQLAGK